LNALLVILPLLAVAMPAMVQVAPGEELAVLDEGPPDGTIVVLVPGLSGCAYGFRELNPLLHAQGLRTISIAPLAVGLSARTSGADYTLTAQAGRLARVLDKADVTDAVVVAQGVSASMALRLALNRPELIRGLVSVEGGAAESAITPTVRRGLKLAKVVNRLGGASMLRDHFADDLRKASGDPGWVNRRNMRHYFRGTGRDIEGTLEAFLAMTRQTEPELLAPRLHRLAIPVVLLQGGAPHEGALDPLQVGVLEAGIRDLQVRVVAGAGHFIYEEQPEAVVEAVVAILDRLQTAQP
jgi:pimeloyl-ACP methyl ester carboxylesterase